MLISTFFLFLYPPKAAKYNIKFQNFAVNQSKPQMTYWRVVGLYFQKFINHKSFQKNEQNTNSVHDCPCGGDFRSAYISIAHC